MTEIKELLPRPFCNGGAEYDTAFNYICGDYIAYVRCVDCFVQIRTEDDIESVALDDAVDNWNSRVFRDSAQAVSKFADRYHKRIERMIELLKQSLPFIEGQREESFWDEEAINLAQDIREALSL